MKLTLPWAKASMMTNSDEGKKSVRRGNSGDLEKALLGIQENTDWPMYM